MLYKYLINNEIIIIKLSHNKNLYHNYKLYKLTQNNLNIEVADLQN